MSAAPRTVALIPHPDAGAGVVRGIGVALTRAPDGVLGVTFVLDAPLDAVRVPPPATPRMEFGLWLSTCFEVFVARAGSSAYHEYNLAPSGAWTAFAFRRHRDGEPLLDPALAPGIAVARGPDELRLSARLPLARLAAAYAGAALRLGLSAVVEEASGPCSYWALRHPQGAADFHAAEGFTLSLET